jgi:RNA polymerase sigma-70 factor (ECF subfamily)
MTPIDEQELIARGRRGDGVALDELFARHYRGSLRVARRILSSEEESKDAVQSAYFDAFQRFASFRGDATFQTWITRIVVNRSLGLLRDSWRKRTSVNLSYLEEYGGLESFPSHEPSPEKAAWCNEIATVHAQAVSILPQPLRETYSLYFESGLSLLEVAKNLGLSLAATKSRIFRARDSVRLSLQPVRPFVSEETGRRHMDNALRPSKSYFASTRRGGDTPNNRPAAQTVSI